MDRIWPPTILGKRKASFIDPYVHDSNAVPKFTLCTRSNIGHPNAVILKQISVESVKCDQCPVYVFPPSVEGFIWAMYVDSQVDRVRSSFPQLLCDNWTLKYATVQDMVAIDPHRKLVDWIPLHTSKEINNYDIPIRMIGTPQCLSAVQKEEFQAKLRKLDDAEKLKEIQIMKSENLHFASKMKSSMEGLKIVKKFVNDMTFRGSHIKKAFAFDGVRVANASFERLSSLGVLMDEKREHDANAFTSRLIHRGTERELENLQTTTNEIQYATATLRRLTQLESDLLESTRVLVKRQIWAMMQHLVEWDNKYQKLMEEIMLARVKLVTSSQQREKKAYVLRKFISSGAAEIAEEANRDALEAKEQELIEKAKSSIHECCICCDVLEGFILATSEDGEKRHKRSCFLPCMHANVCTTCSEKRWNEGPRECPICRQPLTERPRVIYI